MSNKATLSVGYIPYLNCVPCFHYLKECGFAGKMVSGVPSALNTMLQLGELDVSPSSSFEYARHWQDYLLLPGHSISSIGKVESVLLFSPVELADLEGQQIAITGESATSINLLRLILCEFHQLNDVSDAVPAVPVEEVIAQGQPALLIGDRALRLAAKKPGGMKVFDLGEIWHQQTGLPFVFALWMVRKEALSQHTEALSKLSGQLSRSYQQVMHNPWPVAEKQTGVTGLSAEQIVDYWNSIDYRLDDGHLVGLHLFFSLCTKHRLLAESPKIEFFHSNTPAMID